MKISNINILANALDRIDSIIQEGASELDYSTCSITSSGDSSLSGSSDDEQELNEQTDEEYEDSDSETDDETDSLIQKLKKKHKNDKTL